MTTDPLNAPTGALPRGLDPEAARLYVRPLGIVWGRPPGGEACAFAGGRAWFSWVELAVREGSAVTRTRAPASEVRRWAARIGARAEERIATFLDNYATVPPPFAGLTLDRPRVMGIVNVTPDSFSDGGDFATPEAAIARGRTMAAAGADILDIGGESTRPGSDTVPAADEIARVVPAIRALAGDGALVSTDTRKSAVMTAAIGAGARLVNDVSALTFDPDSLAAVAGACVPAILMHAQGDPKTMQRDPRYVDPALDVFDVLEARLAAATAAGISRADIMVDPGIGFGKGMEHNLAILAELALFKGLGVGLLLGVSRKSFIGRIAGVPDPRERLPGSLALALDGLDRGADMVRVHDVPETVQALALWRTMRNVS